jgi:phosphatidate cytidylyltransferase
MSRTPPSSRAGRRRAAERAQRAGRAEPPARSGPRSGGRRPPPARGGSDLPARVVVAIPALVFAIFIIDQGGPVFAVGALLLCIVCLHELFRMYEPRGPVKLAGFAALIGLAAAAYYGTERQVLLATVASIPVVFLLGLAMPARSEATRTDGVAITMLGIVWIGLALAHAILLRQLDGPGEHGAAIIVDVLVGTFVGDTGAYLGGRYLGRRPLATRISPNKTVEGLLIGMLTAIAATWCAGLYQDWLTHGQALLLGLAVAVSAPLGDLFESQVKRDAGTKDAGSLFGAHGGALDRLDAAFFALVAGYYVYLAMS